MKTENKKSIELGNQKIIYQLFIGKVAEVLGMEKTIQLLKESKESINNIKR